MTKTMTSTPPRARSGHRDAGSQVKRQLVSALSLIYLLTLTILLLAAPVAAQAGAPVDSAPIDRHGGDDEEEGEDDEEDEEDDDEGNGGEGQGRPDDPGKPDRAGVVRFHRKAFVVREDTGEAVIRVDRHRGDEGEVSVDFTTVDGSAEAGVDYDAVSGTLSWADGDDDSKTFTVPILDDLDVEGTETVHLVLENLTGDATLQPGLGRAVLKIRDDDGDDDPEPPEEGECGECDGQVSELSLRYNGTETVDVVISQRVMGEHEVIFEDTVEPGETFEIEGENHIDTLGPFIRLFVDGELHTSIHTSCSEPIGPGLVAGDFEVVEGESRNGGDLCPIEGGEDDEEEGEDEECGECEGQVEELTLQYLGDETVQVTVTQRVFGEHVVIFDEVVEPGETFEIEGENHRDTLGPFIRLFVDDDLNASIHTSCSEPIGPGLVAGDFEVVDGESRNGGDLCPLDEQEGEDEGEEDECGECEGQVEELTLQYLGDETVQVTVTQRVFGEHVVIFDEVVEPGDTFTLEGINHRDTLGPFIRLFVDDEVHTSIHTSCSEPIGPGLVAGDFEVVDGESRNGGDLCPLDAGSEEESLFGPPSLG